MLNGEWLVDRKHKTLEDEKRTPGVVTTGKVDISKV